MNSILKRLCKKPMLVGIMAIGVASIAMPAYACVVGGGGTLIASNGGLMEEDFEAGRWISGGGGTVTFLQSCTWSAAKTLRLKVNLPYHGDVNGIPTFNADINGYVGVQIKHKNGNQLRDGENVLDLRSERGVVHEEFELSFVALRHMPRGVYYYGSGEDVLSGEAVEDGLALPLTAMVGTKLEPARSARCTIIRNPPLTVEVPTALRSILPTEGSRGASREFSFAWSCDGGNDGTWPGGMHYTFSSTSAIPGKDGYIATTGSASGVDLLVERQTVGSRTWEAIRFGRYVEYGSASAVGREEKLRVQFVRNSDTLEVGQVEGSMKVEVNLL